MSQQTSQIIRQLLNSWQSQNKVVADFFNKYDDSYYYTEVAPHRNRAIYLLGHLVAMNDGMFPLLDIGERLFPGLEQVFITSPDRAIDELPSLAELRLNWMDLNEALAAIFDNMEPDEWLEKHTMVTDADFAKDPLRNKLNVLIGRINHQSHHIGQLIFLTPRN